MQSTFTRQTHNTSYVAYSKSASKPIQVQVAGQDSTVPVHSQVLIREFVSIEIDSIDDARATSQRQPTLYVKFNARSAKNPDGESVGLRENFGASIQAGGDLEKAVRHALTAGKAVYVAIETKRRYKNSAGEIISYLTPINELRGATKDGKGGSASATRENCANVIAAIGPADAPTTNLISDEVTSDPSKWATFRSNHDGTQVPSGFVRVNTPEGDPTGAITAAESAPAAAPASVDVDALAEAVAARLHGAAPTNGTPASSGAVRRPALREVHSVEAKPWEPYNSDGRANAGSYLTASWRNTWSGAMILLTTAAYEEQDAAERAGREPRLLESSALASTATDLTEVLLAMADQVQTAVVGRINRMDRSHGEAGKWVHQIASRLVPITLEMLSEEHSEQREMWRKTVIAQAAAVFAAALHSVESYLDGQYDRPTPINDASRKAREQAGRQAQQGNAATSTSGAQMTSTNAAIDDAATGDDALMQRWNAFLQQCKLTGHEDRVKPFLAAACGTADLAQIQAQLFSERLSAWEAEPQRFVEAAASAYRASQPVARQSA
ncbi:hypothetical protein [Rhodococcus qingshengii]|uniref:Uncharacterized protein n=1 Tax=Rhodococcus qingshengii TaxID=334542 RepID=A0A2A5J444_RHOSG|nr:hypothetical protein [Rhodococcus qingshengii]PCK24374.1 hypothetical protein CHR55_26150 [Rhodococcus qingshengii]